MDITLEILQERLDTLEKALSKLEAHAEENPHGQRLDGLEAGLAEHAERIDGLNSSALSLTAQMGSTVERAEALIERIAVLEREQLELLEAIAEEEDVGEEEEDQSPDVTEIVPEPGEGEGEGAEAHNPPAFWERLLGGR